MSQNDCDVPLETLIYNVMNDGYKVITLTSFKKGISVAKNALFQLNQQRMK